MTPNMRMEQFSLAYVRAIAAEGGYQVGRPEPDVDSVDGVLLASFGRRPRIDFQAKATSQQLVRNGIIHFPLPVKNYDELRADTLTPRILIVLLMPRDDANWITQSENELCLRHCAYWLSLAGRPDVRNVRAVTVQIPTANMLDRTQLDGLMSKANSGSAL